MWVALGAPFDSAARGEGEERAAQALRDAGILEGLGAKDLGDVAEPLRPPVRDRRAGILAFESLVRGSRGIANTVAEALEAGDRPLVLGGDCSFLIGAIAGARRAGLSPGLLFVDGHADYFDGASSPTGEAADMELAILHGRGPEALAGEALAGMPAGSPLLEPGRTAILGHRPPELHPDVAAERERVPAEVLQLDAPAIRELGPAAAASKAMKQAGEGGQTWLHLDLDVLDERELPAVSYPQAEGLSWSELEALLVPMMAAGVLGLSVADYNPDLDPAGEHAGRVSRLLVDIVNG